MFRLKIQPLWPIILAIVVISAIYILAAITLLQSYSANIAFTQKELRGLDDYEQSAELYFSSSNSASLKQHIRTIGDESNLILDPELSSYYAVDILFNHVPLLVEHVFIYSKNQAGSLQDLPYHLSNLDHSISMLSDQHCMKCPLLKQQTETIKDRLLAIKQHPLTHDKSQDLIVQIQKIAHSSSVILREKLDGRLRSQKDQYYKVLAIIAVLYVVLIALIGFALRNYVSKREVNLAKERQKLITQLAQKNDELEKFAHAAAHDLKEPVRTMRCFATLLKSESPDELTEATAEYVNVIENTAQRAEQMINDLLGYTQVSEEALAMERCDCNMQVAAVLQDLKPVIDAVKPEITIAALPSVQTVPSMFRRVILNLIDNALKYRKRDALLTINIHAEKQDECWLFSVRDNGIGLASEHKETVFEPFRRLEPALYKEGNGIGLTSCKKIIERLGGRIWIASDLDQGTTIYFTLPI